MTTRIDLNRFNKGEGQLAFDEVGAGNVVLPAGGPQWQSSSLQLTSGNF